MDPKTKRDWERAYARLVRKLLKVTVELEELGENEMGVLHLRLARRFHRATDSIRRLTVELTQDVQWPHEPMGPHETATNYIPTSTGENVS